MHYLKNSFKRKMRLFYCHFPAKDPINNILTSDVRKRNMKKIENNSFGTNLPLNVRRLYSYNSAAAMDSF